MRFYLVIISMVLASMTLPFGLYAQQQIAVDSIERAMATASYDTLVAKSYNDLAVLFKNSDPDKGRSHSGAGIRFCEEKLENKDLSPVERLSYTRTLATLFHQSGSSYHERADFPEAVDFFKRAFMLSEKYGFQKLAADSTFKVDSLVAVLERTRDTLSVDLLAEIGRGYRITDIEVGLTYANKAMTMAKELGYKKGQAIALGVLSANHVTRTEYDKALEYALRGLELSKEINDRSLSVKLLNELAIISDYKNNRVEELNYDFEALRLLEEENEQTGEIIYILENIGASYSLQGYHDKGMPYLERALLLVENETDRKFEKKAFILITMGVILQRQGNNTEALDHLSRALAIAKKNYDLIGIWRSLKYIGLVHQEQGNGAEALDYFLRALEACEEIEGKVFAAEILTMIGSAYYEAGAYPDAIRYAVRGLSLGGEAKDKKEIMANSEILFRAYVKVSDYRKAFDYQSLYLAYSDSISVEDNEKEMGRLLAKFEYDKKREAQQRDIAENEALYQDRMDRQQTYTLFGALIILLAIGLLFLTHRSNGQRKRVNLQLMGLDRAKTRLYANISHELRTPLTLISAPLHDSTDGHLDRRDLKMMTDNVEKLQNLVDEILDLSKLESGAKLTVNSNNVDLKNFINRSFFSYQSFADERKVKMNLDYRLPEGVWIRTDLNKVSKILDNLVSNAFKHTPDGGTISLLTMLEGKNLKLMVSDTGDGIHPDDLPHIFDRYYQSPINANGNFQKGTGIGLSLAKEYAQLIDGSITVASGPGQGSDFVLYFPFTETSPPVEEKGEIYTVPGTDGLEEIHYQPDILLGKSKPCVLIAEDQQEMGNYLFRKLESSYRVVLARDGVQALEKLDTNRVDLILSDVMMPNMDGFTFKERLGEHKVWSTIPFIIFTAKGDGRDRVRGFKLGIDDYITKPFNLAELKARMENLLKNKHNRSIFVEDLQKNGEEGDVPEEGETVREELVRKAEANVLENLSDESYKVTDLCKALSYSQRQLDRIIKRQTGLTPVAFIREIRLQQAYLFLSEQRYLSVKEVRYDIGIGHASYFTQIFTRRFGKSPKEVLGKV